VPAVFESLEDADRLHEAVKTSGLKYMMFETSCFHADLHHMREIYKTGGLGELVYAEGEYYHYMPEPIDSFKGWRIGLPPSGTRLIPTPITSESAAAASRRFRVWECQVRSTT